MKQTVGPVRRNINSVNYGNLFTLIITQDNEVFYHTRSVYTFMNLVGEIGGTLGVFTTVLGFIITPITNHSFFVQIVSELLIAKTKNNKLFSNNKTKKVSSENKVLDKNYHFISLGFFSSLQLFFL